MVGTVLDVGPGRTRIRQLPEISPDALIIGYRFEDVNMVDEDNFIGRLEFPDDEEADCFVLNGEGEWIDVCNLAGGDLDWETDGTDVWTGHGMNDFPAGDVTIGDIPGNNARLSVIDVAQSAWRSGQYVEVTGTPGAVGTMRGIHVNTDGSMGNQHVGVDALARSGKLALGGRFTAILDSDQSQWCAGAAGYAFGSVEANHDVIGVFARAENTDPQGDISGLDTRPIGLYCEGINNGTIAGATAATFFGNFNSLTAPITLSDESVKNNITDVENGIELLMQINPKKYNHAFEEAFGISADTTLSYGFLAQEVAEVFPEATGNVYTPSRYDTSGTLLSESANHLGIKYDYFIPLLVAGFKEQNALAAEQAQIIDDQEETIEELEEEVAGLTSSLSELQNSVAQLESMVQQSLQKSDDCCAKILGMKTPATGKQNELEQNAPNPFDEQTRIAFTLASNGNVKLLITNSTGQTVETLANGAFSSGRHEVTWNASGQAPGVYYYTLYVDGELMTKKMIKL